MADLLIWLQESEQTNLPEPNLSKKPRKPKKKFTAVEDSKLQGGQLRSQSQVDNKAKKDVDRLKQGAEVGGGAVVKGVAGGSGSRRR